MVVLVAERSVLSLEVTRAEAEAFLARCVGADYAIQNLEQKPGKRTPAPPFTTSPLQQEASRKLGFSVAQTMSVAQKLYEAGKISYMRTDSVNLSGEALAGAQAAITAAYRSEERRGGKGGRSRWSPEH